MGYLRYRVYGLTLAAEFPLNDVPDVKGRAKHPDVIVRQAETDIEAISTRDSGAVVEKQGKSVYISSVLGKISIACGRYVDVFATPGENVSDVFELYMVPVMGIILHQRGFLTLHASAVEVNGCGVAFIGPKGVGKSTTASLFHSRGHRIITDDMLALRIHTQLERPMVRTGLPWIKLNPDALSAVLNEEPALHRRVITGSEKRFRPLEAGLQSDGPVPLERIYALSFNRSGDRETELKSLSSRQACLFLLGQSYAQMILKSKGCEEHLRQCSSLVNAVPMKLLARNQALQKISAVYDLVMHDLEDKE